MIEKRTTAFFGLFTLLMFFCILILYTISTGTGLAETAERQSTYRITLARSRGTIYDCNHNPLTGTEKEYVAAVAPTVKSAAALTNLLPNSQIEQIYPTLTKGKPFALKLPSDKICAEGIDVFEVDKRYGNNQVATNVIGYLDGTGKGIAGIEKAYENELSKNQGKISILYKVDAVNRILPGEEKTIENSYDKKNSGVMLTINKQIQQIAEEAAQKYLKKGAIVITEVPNCEIRAMASVPTYSPNNLDVALKAADSPLLNRAISAYNVGSVFKLVSAAAALEDGVSSDTEYVCAGGITVSGDVFHCNNSKSHGKLKMKDAIAQSCNGYFINLMQKVSHERFLNMADNLGFGKQTELATGFYSNAGNLPKINSLLVPKALANFSFGQGELLATPLQISGMINAIAADGFYATPQLVLGLVDDQGNYVNKTEKPQAKQVMSKATAKYIQQAMAACVEYGTGKNGKPSEGSAGAKTGTAQTGKFVDKKEQVQMWYTGFYPQNNPKYVITVFGENGTEGSGICGSTFKFVADSISQKIQ